MSPRFGQPVCFDLLSLLVQTELKLGKVNEAKMYLRELWDKSNQLGEDIGYAYAHDAQGILELNGNDWE